MQELQKRQIPEQTVIAIAHSGAHSEIGKVYHELYTWAKQNRVHSAGKPFTVFLNPPSEFDPSSGLFEVCMPVGASTKGNSKIIAKKIPATTVAVGTVTGPYSEIPAHYTEMLAWLDTQGWEVAGAPREVYVKGPDARGKGNPKEFVTEIQFPVGA